MHSVAVCYSLLIIKTNFETGAIFLTNGSPKFLKIVVLLWPLPEYGKCRKRFVEVNVHGQLSWI